mmetsp:Transcript_42995/g.134905  ORF Transcript_42995/g.134905 Transcript_42995/m.134905 type:complete len:233 (-) Transcript_42995:421-1119(-)
MLSKTRRSVEVRLESCGLLTGGGTSPSPSASSVDNRPWVIIPRLGRRPRVGASRSGLGAANLRFFLAGFSSFTSSSDHDASTSGTVGWAHALFLKLSGFFSNSLSRAPTAVADSSRSTGTLVSCVSAACRRPPFAATCVARLCTSVFRSVTAFSRSWHRRFTPTSSVRVAMSSCCCAAFTPPLSRSRRRLMRRMSSGRPFLKRSWRNSQLRRPLPFASRRRPCSSLRTLRKP